MMTTNMSPRGSATIYQFPLGGRAGLSSVREDVKPKVEAQRASVDAFGSGWYHEAAIEEAKRTLEH
jgi:uncharacterized protein DUF2735